MTSLPFVSLAYVGDWSLRDSSSKIKNQLQILKISSKQISRQIKQAKAYKKAIKDSVAPCKSKHVGLTEMAELKVDLEGGKGGLHNQVLIGYGRNVCLCISHGRFDLNRITLFADFQPHPTKISEGPSSQKFHSPTTQLS